MLRNPSKAGVFCCVSHDSFLFFLFSFFFHPPADGKLVKIKHKLPRFDVPDTCPCFDLTHAPVATAARAAATGPVSMSTRPDPEGSDTVEMATRRLSSSPDSVGLARQVRE